MENSLSNLHPELAREWSERNLCKPTEVASGSHKKAWWKGTCGHEWESEIHNRTGKGNGCPYCSGRKLLKGFNDLATRFPDVAYEWSPRNNDLKPDMVTAFSNRRVWWRCRTCGNEWYALISTISGGSKCPFCSGVTLLPGFNDLKTNHPELADEWSPRNGTLLPEKIGEKSRRNVWWKCSSCGHEYKAVISSRVNGLICPVCANRLVRKGFNDLATTDHLISEEWDCERNSILPSMVMRSSSKRVWWKCGYGHHWSMSVAERCIEGKGCIYCEQDFLASLPRMAAVFYASRLDLKVLIGDDIQTGLPLEAYVPEVGLAIDIISRQSSENRKKESLKRFLCEKRGITLVEITADKNADGVGLLREVKKAFREKSLIFRSDEEEDLKIIRLAFDKLRKENR